MARNTVHGQKVPMYKTWWFWVIIILFIYGFVSNMTGNDDEEETEQETQAETDDIFELAGDPLIAAIDEIL